MDNDFPPTVEIVISVPADEMDLVAAELRERGGDVLVAADRGFDGAETIDLLLTLTSALAGIVASMYAKRMNANRYISIKYKGLEVKGVSESALLKILDRVKPGSKSS